jgi:hypothetical protein
MLPADRDRDRAADSLRRHYMRGRLTVEELSERLELALGARSDRDLGRAMRGLPAPWGPGERQTLAVTVGRAAKRTALFVALAGFWCFLSMLLLIAFIAVLAAGASGLEVLAVPVIWLVASWMTWRAWRTGAR